MKKRFNAWPYIITFLLILVFISIAYLWVKRKPEPFQLPDRSWYIDTIRFTGSAHGKMKCESCHLDYALASEQHPSKTRVRTDATIFVNQVKCARCHPRQYITYLYGHEQLRARSAREIPGCGDCHDIHYQKDKSSRVVIGEMITTNCGRCHPREKAGYLENYHGKTAILFGYKSSAYCQDCHGGHLLIPVSQKGLMLRRCRACHPKFTPKAVGYVVHAVAKERGIIDPLIRKVELAMLLFIIIVLAVFYLHASLWGIRLWHDRVRGEDK